MNLGGCAKPDSSEFEKANMGRPCCFGPLVIWRLILRLLFGSYNLSLGVKILVLFYMEGTTYTDTN